MSALVLVLLSTPLKEYTVDPIAPEGGDVWFNVSEGSYKIHDFQSFNAGVWSSGASNVKLTSYGISGFGSQEDCVAVGGNFSGTTTTLYDGVSWSTDVASGFDSQYGAGTGTSSGDGLIFDGHNHATETFVCHLWSGVSWSITGSLLGYKSFGSLGGTTTDALAFIGVGGSMTQLFDGSTWSNASANVSGYGAGSGFSSNSCFYSNLNKLKGCASFNGSAWVSKPDALRNREANPVGFGDTSSFVVNGGTGQTTDEFDGTSWSSAADVDSQSVCG